MAESGWLFGGVHLLQIFFILIIFIGGYIVIFWTPLRFILMFLLCDRWKWYKWKRKANKLSASLREECLCWLHYDTWVNLCLAWRIGLEWCQLRSKDSWFSVVHASIYKVLSPTPPAQITSCTQKFTELRGEQISCLAQYISREFLAGKIGPDEITTFLREERRCVHDHPKEFLMHADRLTRCFGIRPFFVQAWRVK